MAENSSGDLVARWRDGDQLAAAALFHEYAGRLIALARSRLSAKLASRVDPEDVVQSAYRSFFANARDGRYHVQSDLDLWQLLVAITLHKIQDQAEHHAARKRAVRREQSIGGEDSLFGLQAHLLARGPSPAEAAALTDEVERIMRRFGPAQRRILELRLQGYNVEEIAAEVRRSECTVRRLLKEVRQELQPRAPGGPAEG